MQEIIDLNKKNLPLLSEGVSVPRYERANVKAGIVHIGVGGFHRAHQAFFTNALLNKNEGKGWGICGICLLERDKKMYDVLHRQDGLYTLVVKDPLTSAPPAVIGSIVEYYYAPDNPEKVIKKMADSAVKIITLTITEGGYNFNHEDGSFKIDDPDVQWDIAHPSTPKTVFGYLTAALKERKEHHLPVTIQSCDNIQHNGQRTRDMLWAYIEVAEPQLLSWVKTHVSFPNSMVDRITPVTQAEDIQWLQKNYQIRDAWPVVTEDFYQWIIEDDFKAGRPPWDKVGAQFVEDVTPYEKMKIRLLNGGHSLLGFIGWHAGYSFINEVVKFPLFQDYYRQYMDEEVSLTLDAMSGIDLNAYREKLIQRFSNPYIKDRVERIILGSSAKIPGFVIPTIKENLQAEQSIRCCTMIVACWYLYLEKKLEEDCFDEVEDEGRDVLKEKMLEVRSSSVLAFLRTESLFGNLAESKKFTTTFIDILQRVKQQGMKEAVRYETIQ